MNYDDRLTEDARLVILKELAAQIDGRANEILLCRVLERFGITRSREWVRTQMMFLAGLDAVHCTDAGTVKIAELRKAGRNHLERRHVIDGVARPSDPD